MTKTMKTTKIFGLIVMAALLSVTTACNDWLDVKPTTELDQRDLLATERGYADALTSAYTKLASESLYGRNLSWGMLDILAGRYSEWDLGWGTVQEQMGKYAYKHSNQDRSDDLITLIDGVWSTDYNIIANVNNLLATIDDDADKFSGNNFNIMKGEMLGLRAFTHFDLLRMYGYAFPEGRDSVMMPYITQFSAKTTPMTSEENVIDSIIRDLTLAKQLMAADPMHTGSTPDEVLAPVPTGSYKSYGIPVWHNRRFRFNYYAATAMLARAYLWKGDKANALAQAKEIISEQEQSEKFAWVNSDNLSTIGTGASNQDRTFATEQLFSLNIPLKTFDNYMDGYIYFNESSIDASTDLLNAVVDCFEDKTSDPRLQYLFNNTSNMFFLSKFYQDKAVEDFFQERMPLIRLSEMYYIAAECCGNVAEGVGYLNTVRDHRGLADDKLDTGISSEELQEEITKEYQKEFFGEGQLWFYYKRLHYAEIPNMSNFSDPSLFVFDRPQDEDLYRK